MLMAAIQTIVFRTAITTISIGDFYVGSKGAKIKTAKAMLRPIFGAIKMK